jgi:hypothetical protein
MKIRPDHLNHLKIEIDEVLFQYNQDNKLVKEYQSGDYPRSEFTKDVQKRFCFDLMYGAGLSQFVSDHLYSYLNDDHIYTALKTICPKIGGNTHV